jgi:hypothetical protein
MLLEKYMQAAETIVARAVPLERRVTPQIEIGAGDFRGTGAGSGRDSELRISLYDPADLTAKPNITKSGTYRVVLNASVNGSFAYDPGRAEVEWFVDGQRLMDQPLKWEAGRPVESTTEVKWQAGEHILRLTLKPLVGKDQKPAENQETARPMSISGSRE